MTLRTRRSLVAGALAALAAGPALGQEGGKSVEVGKAFPYLENYWKIPAAERSRFTVAYYLSTGGKPAAGLKGWIDHAGARTPLVIGAEGRVQRLPSLAQIRGKAMLRFDVPASTQFSMIMAIEPVLRPALEVSARELALSIEQGAKGARKVAGLMGMAMPKLDMVAFKGVGSGTVVHADGRTSALPVQKGSPVFQPAKLKTAQTLLFPKVPTQMIIGSSSG